MAFYILGGVIALGIVFIVYETVAVICGFRRMSPEQNNASIRSSQEP